MAQLAEDMSQQLLQEKQQAKERKKAMLAPASGPVRRSNRSTAEATAAKLKQAARGTGEPGAGRAAGRAPAAAVQPR